MKKGVYCRLSHTNSYTPFEMEVSPHMRYNNIELNECQVVRPLDKRFLLHDVSASGRERPWRSKKMANELLSAAYEAIDHRKAERLRECASVLVFNVDPDGNKHLHSMTSCRVRLCPLCQWRRSLRVYQDMLKVVDYLGKNGKYKYILLTLTVANCSGDKLSETLDTMMHGINLLFQRSDVKKAVKGWYRGIEITRNHKDGTYHPHVHILLCVNQSYATSRYYISQIRWRTLWKDCCNLAYDPQCDVRFLKGDLRKGFAEVAKYAAKETDYIIPDDFDLTVDTVSDLDSALHKRRLISYGGIIAEARRALKLENEETADLIHVDDEAVSSDVVRQVVYFWSSGFSDYIGHIKE